MARVNETPEIDSLYINFQERFVVLENGVTLPIDSFYDDDGDEVDDYKNCRFLVAGRDNYWINIDLDEYQYKQQH